MSGRGRDLAMGNRFGLEPNVGAEPLWEQSPRKPGVAQSAPGPGELSFCPVSPGQLVPSADRCCAAHPGYDTDLHSRQGRVRLKCRV